MRKVRFTEHKIIAVLKSVETGRAVRTFAVKLGSLELRTSVCVLPNGLGIFEHIT